MCVVTVFAVVPVSRHRYVLFGCLPTECVQKMKSALFQAESKVRTLQAQLAETYSDRMLLDTEKKVGSFR
jgi:hypothetical protein